MTVELVGLAVLMGLVTWPSRALPMLAPGIERLPPRILAYLRLVGPSVLAALAAVNVMLVVDAARRPSFHLGPEWAAVGICLAVVAWRRNLFVGLIAAVIVAAGLRAIGVR